jgi:hypothetical protein
MLLIHPDSLSTKDGLCGADDDDDDERKTKICHKMGAAEH